MSGAASTGGSPVVVVCMTTALDPEERPALEELRRKARSVRRVVNPADRAALEAALRLRDSQPGTVVIALSLAAAADEEPLRWALAQGADEFRRLWGESCADLDSIGVASRLATAARALGADLILCGSRALDGSGGGVGPAMAEFLDLPVLNDVAALSVRGSLMRAERRLRRGLRAEVECRLPAVVVVEEGAFGPRYARLRDRFRALRAGVPVLAPASAGQEDGGPGKAEPRVAVRSLSGPKPVGGGIFVPDQTLSPEAQLTQLMGGPPGPAGGRSSIGGAIDEAVGLLEELRFLD